MKIVVDIFEINVKKIRRIQNFELYHQYFFIRELLDEDIKHIKIKWKWEENTSKGNWNIEFIIFFNYFNTKIESQALIFWEESRLMELVER